MCDVDKWRNRAASVIPQEQGARQLNIAGVQRCATCQRINEPRMPARARCSDVKHCGHPGERQVARVPRVMRWHPCSVQLDRPDRDMCHDLTVDAIPESRHAHGINNAGMRLGATWQWARVALNSRNSDWGHQMPPRSRDGWSPLARLIKTSGS